MTGRATPLGALGTRLAKQRSLSIERIEHQPIAHGWPSNTARALGIELVEQRGLSIG